MYKRHDHVIAMSHQMLVIYFCANLISLLIFLSLANEWIGKRAISILDSPEEVCCPADTRSLRM